MNIQVDHIIYAVPELYAGIDKIERLLGVRAVFGGQHPGKGTHNALLALGESTYLEILAPDPLQEIRPWFPVSASMEPCLLTWATPCEDLFIVKEQSRQQSLGIGEIINGARIRDDGVELRWEMTKPVVESSDGIFPFFINWHGSLEHISTMPHGCTLIDLQGQHPMPEAMAKKLRIFNLNMNIQWAAKPALSATIDAPNGKVILK